MEAYVGLVELARKAVDPRSKISAEQLRKAKPVRNPLVKWEAGPDGTLLLEAPLMQQGRGIAGWLAKRMKKPDTKKFEFEPVGAFLWELFDGQHTVDTISRKLREQYKMNRLEADASLSAFLQMLARRKLITLMLPSGGKK